MELGISALLCPEVERDGGQFVDKRIGQTVPAEVDGFEVGVTGIAAFHADVSELLGSIDRKPGVVFFITAGTNDATEFPLAETEPAEQVAARPVAHRAQNAQAWFAAAERAERGSVALELEGNAGADEFRIGLQKGEDDEFCRGGGHISVAPALAQ